MTAASPAAPDAARERLAAIVDSSDDAILSKNADGIITSWNAGAHRMYGYSPEEAIGQPIGILIPEQRQGEQNRILERVFRGEQVDHYDTERITKGGRMIQVSLSVSPIRGGDGSVIEASVIARDITARQRSLELATMLQEATAALSLEITPSRVSQVALAEVMRAMRAGAGAFGVVERDEVHIIASSGYAEERMSEWLRIPVDAETPMTEAIRCGKPIWSPSAEDLRKRYPAVASGEVLWESLAILPLVSAGESFGVVSLSFKSSREFDSEEQAFLVSVAQQAAHALARAKIYEGERRANRRQRFLAEAGELLTQSLDPEESLQQVAALAVPQIADWCGVDLLDDAGELRQVAVAHVEPEKVELARDLRERYPTVDQGDTGVWHVIRTGESELYPEIPDELLAQTAQDAEHLETLRELGLNSAMVVPLQARGSVFGAITFVASDPDRSFDETDLALAQDLARRGGQAIDNAMLFRREHEAAVVLQRSLLPESLPRIHDDVELGVRYRPAAPGLEVGGDWYDVITVDDDKAAITIGDVAGRGIVAASIMGRLRSALRAYVTDGHSPAETVARLDRLMQESDEPRMATLFHMHYEPETRRLCYVRAGHPPALLRHPDGSVEELGGRGAPPVGILPDFEASEQTVELAPGSLVLLYTDGLIERRDTRLDEELAKLKESLAIAPEGVDECLDFLEERLGTDTIPDDVAMLAMALTG